jgi:hypothetical protein
VEAALSYLLLGHEISLGKTDHWLGPDKGASMLWGNNAPNIYEFQINRVEPLRIPGLSLLTGPFRYDFFVGGLHGHTLVPNPAYQANPSPDIPNVINPGDPWVHMEKISFKPTRDHRVWIRPARGLGRRRTRAYHAAHVPAQLLQLSATSQPRKSLAETILGYRVGTFDFTWRLPYLSHWVTLYTDSVVHDDVSPVSAPRRAGYHPGIYLARFPRTSSISTSDWKAQAQIPRQRIAGINQGQFIYWEYIQRQGPTNNGFLPGDWVGRQGKGGQAWLTYHLSPRGRGPIPISQCKGRQCIHPRGHHAERLRR